jgi:hypothetical protein
VRRALAFIWAHSGHRNQNAFAGLHWRHGIEQVGMTVNQARQHRAASEVDDRGCCGRVELHPRNWADFFDPIVFNQDALVY